MGLLTFALNVTLDGCCDHRAGSPDDELFRYWTRLMDAAGGMLWGRTVYELMENCWLPDEWSGVFIAWCAPCHLCVLCD